MLTAGRPDPGLDHRTKSDHDLIRRRSARHTASLAKGGVRFGPAAKSRVADSDFPEVKRLGLYWPRQVSNNTVS